MVANEIQYHHAKLDLLNSKVNCKSDQLLAEVIWFGILQEWNFGLEIQLTLL